MAAVDCTVIRSQTQSPRPGGRGRTRFLRLDVKAPQKGAGRFEGYIYHAAGETPHSASPGLAGGNPDGKDEIEGAPCGA